MFDDIEKKLNVNYPNNSNATYTSLLNYSLNLDSPFQRWYRYKEGFSIELVQSLIKEFCNDKNGIILDPFLGSGTTCLAANYLNMQGIGFEINPFSFFLAKAKNEQYSKENLKMFEIEYKKIINESKEINLDYTLPKLSFSNKVFNPNIEKYMMNIKKRIDSVEDNKVKNLLLLGWLSSIEIFSNYKKSGNGLKIKRTKKQLELTINDVYDFLCGEYENIYLDLKNKKHKSNSIIYNESSLNMANRIAPETISGVIYSPPYANCFDYTEIYKLELWFGNFVNEYKDLKELRNKTVRSHLNSNLEDNNYSLNHSAILKKLIKELEKKELWDKKIPTMLINYYNDMFNIIDNSYKVLKKDGFCSIVVGNSAYGGVIFPTDLILAKYAQEIGFEVKRIDIYRFIIPSSQQYKLTEKNKKYLRESVICLIKN